MSFGSVQRARLNLSIVEVETVPPNGRIVFVRMEGQQPLIKSWKQIKNRGVKQFTLELMIVNHAAKVIGHRQRLGEFKR